MNALPKHLMITRMITITTTTIYCSTLASSWLRVAGKCLLSVLPDLDSYRPHLTKLDHLGDLMPGISFEQLLQIPDASDNPSRKLTSGGQV